MAVPDTNTFSLQDVVDEITPTTNDLVDCIADANEPSYDPTYYTAPATSLLEFRNYGAAVVPSVTGSFGSTSGTGSLAITFPITSGDTIAVVVVYGTASLGTIGVSDTESAAWNHFSTPLANMTIYYTNDVIDLGDRTVTITSDSTFMQGIAFGMTDAPTTLTGTPTSNSDTATSATTISVSYTPRDVKSLLLSVGMTHRPTATSWDSYGSGQTLEDERGSSGSLNMRTAVTSENTGATSADTQSFTNSNTDDNKYIVSFDIIPV